MGHGLIVQLNSLAFQVAMRGFFAPIVKFLFYLIENAIDLMYELAGHRFGLNEEIEKFSNDFFTIFVIFMVFRLTISLLNYIVNPDSFADKSSGFSKLIIKVIVSIVLLVSINPAFELMYNIQNDILFGDNNVIDNLILHKQEIYTISVGGEEQDVYITRMSDYCPEGYHAYAFTKGGIFSIMALKPFYQPTDKNAIDDTTEWEEFLENNETGYCGFNFEEESGSATFTDDVPATFETLDTMPHTASQYINHNIYETKAGDWDIVHEEDFVIDFRYFWGLIFGIVMLLLIINYCFDVVIRTFTLFLYQIIAPVPIISYMSPDKKNSDMLFNWLKKTVGCWASLFVRFIVLDFVIYFSQIALNTFSNNESGLIVQLFVLIGLLMFAKKLPKLLEEVIPGLKFSGLQLNPFKRISQEALGGNAVLGAGAALGSAGLSGLTNFGQRLGETVQNTRAAWNRTDENGNPYSTRERLRNASSTALRGARRTAGSTIAGAARGGINAFGRTSKDGKMFSGAWNGYQTAMYSKLLREDNRRKGGTAIGSLAADLHRYTGTLNRGQQEQIRAQELDNAINAENARINADQEALDTDKRNLSERKRALARQKEERLQPYTDYSDYAQRIKDRIANEKAVRDAQKDLDDAQATGDENKIRTARQALEAAEHYTADQLFRNDNEVRHYVNKLEELRRNNVALQAADFDFQKIDASTGETIFDAKAIFNTKHEANVIEDRDFKPQEANFAIEERAFERRQDAINADKLAVEQRKQTPEYITTHDQSSPAKVDNATRKNKDVQPAGATFSAERPAQSRMYDNAYYSGFNNQRGNGGGPGPGPGPGPGTP